MPLKRPPLLLSAVLVALATAAPAAPPKPNFTDLPAYVRALNASSDPEAVAIRKEIAAGPAALAREKAAAEADGIPLGTAQARPPDQNATPLYDLWNKTRRQRQMTLPNYAEPLHYGYAYTPEQIAGVQKIVDDNRDLFDLLHRAADRTALAYASGDFTYFAALREAAREINTESFLLARAGRYAEAVTSQARGFRIARQTGFGPTLISYFVGGAVDSITLAGMQGILHLAGSNAEVAAQVQQAIRAAQPVLSLKAALTGEFAFSLSQGDNLRAVTPDGLPALMQNKLPLGPDPAVKVKTFTPEGRRFVNNLLDASEAEFLSHLRRLIDAADQPPVMRRAIFAATAAAPEQPDNPVLVLSASIQSFAPKLDEKDTQLLAGEEVVMAGAAVLAAKARAGTFPDALPGNFADPFTGKPLGYRRDGDNGFVVFSAGADGTFDGGKPGEYNSHPFQVFFRYPGPPPQPVPPDMLK